jgi:hypothetical protein
MIIILMAMMLSWLTQDTFRIRLSRSLLKAMLLWCCRNLSKAMATTRLSVGLF